MLCVYIVMFVPRGGGKICNKNLTFVLNLFVKHQRCMHAWLTEFYDYGKRILKTSTDSVVVKVEEY